MQRLCKRRGPPSSYTGYSTKPLWRQSARCGAPQERASMSIHITTCALGVLLLMNFPSESSAQSLQSAPLPNKPACSPTASVVSILLRDAAGKPVAGATIEMTRVRDRTSLGKAVEMRSGSGEFALLESDALTWVHAKGDSVRLRARAGARSATAVVVVGRDPTGCRIVRLSGPDVMTLK